MKKNRLEIIDSSSTTAYTKERYIEVAEDLRDIFATFLDEKHYEAKAIYVRDRKEVRLQMSWRKPNTKVDSGVYTKRHMEAYKGERPQKWECGLRRDGQKQIDEIRVKYLHTIINSLSNDLREQQMTEAYQFR